MRTVLTAIALLLGAVTAQAQVTIYVDAAAGTGGNGTAGSPYNSIQTGINSAVAGDTVLVQPGTYQETIDFLGKDITVESTEQPSSIVPSSYSTVIDGAGNGPVVSFTSGETTGALLRGFVILGGDAAGLSSSTGGGIHIENSSPSVMENIIENNATDTDGGGVCVLGGSEPLLVGNLIRNNTADGWGGGVFVYGDTSDPQNPVLASPVIYRSRVSGNSAGWDGGGLAIFEACAAYVAQTVVDGNTAGEVGGGIFVGYDVPAQLVNLTVADNVSLGSDVSGDSGPVSRVGRGGGLACWFSDSTTAESSVFWGNTAKDSEGDQLSLEGSAVLGTIFTISEGGEAATFTEAASALNWGVGSGSVDPLFAPTAGDYHLQSRAGRYDPVSGTWVRDASSSPLIDAGKGSASFDDEPAPAGVAINIGAYGNTEEASMAGLPMTIGLAAEGDWDWVYVNTPQTTQNRHLLTYTISVLDDPNGGNTSYDVQVTQVGGSGGVVIEPTEDPFVWKVLGGPRTTAGTGPAELRFYVAGNDGGNAEITSTLEVRPLGDINGDGSTDARDKSEINDVLNGIGSAYPDRALDLTGDGSVDARDKSPLNDILNGISVQ